MITHYSRLRLPTLSVQGAIQFYHDQLCFPLVSSTDREASFRPTEHFTLTLFQAESPVAAAHLAFEVPYSTFERSVAWLTQEAGVMPLKWPDGRKVTDFETGKSVYFKDGDGHLLEIIAHSYVQEDVLEPQGELGVLYLREIGFPVNRVDTFRASLVQRLGLRLDKVYDDFTFAIGGTAHMVLCSKQRRWIPIAMTALPPDMEVAFGVDNVEGSANMERIRSGLEDAGIPYDRDGEGRLHALLEGYRVTFEQTTFAAEIVSKLCLPLAE